MTIFCSRKSTLFILVLLLYSSKSFAWSNHALITEIALQNVNEINNDNLVKTESLESFLRDTYQGIPELLDQVEHWSINRKNTYSYAHYSSTPKELAFTSYSNDPQIEIKFLKAMRINPTMKFPLYLQLLPGDEKGNRRLKIKATDILLPEISKNSISYEFVKIRSGELLTPLSVVTTASDEPDYGFDIALFDDSPNSKKLNYHFGEQPFGNPHLVFSSQAPFHMGFYHNSSLIYKAAPFLKKTYAEYRFYLFKELALFAFKNHHPYWGYRFLGWSLHYIQDLTQPFHVTPLPGYSTSDLIAFNILDALEGAFKKTHKRKNDVINIISNRHLTYEQMIYNYLSYIRKNKISEDRLSNALAKNENDFSYPVTIDNYIREVITREAYKETAPNYGSIIFSKYNQDISAIIGRTLPYKYVSDPEYIFDFSIDTLEIMKGLTNIQKENMMILSTKLMRNVGIHTRNVTKNILQNR